MSDYNIILWVDGIKREEHKIYLPYGCKQWYTQVTSIGAFSSRESTKLYKNNLKGVVHTKGKRCHVRFGSEIQMDDYVSELLLQIGIAKEILPCFEHATVWDFYKAVGYDYKKKKYIDWKKV